MGLVVGGVGYEIGGWGVCSAGGGGGLRGRGGCCEWMLRDEAVGRGYRICTEGTWLAGTRFGWSRYWLGALYSWRKRSGMNEDELGVEPTRI